MASVTAKTADISETGARMAAKAADIVPAVGGIAANAAITNKFDILGDSSNQAPSPDQESCNPREFSGGASLGGNNKNYSPMHRISWGEGVRGHNGDFSLSSGTQ